MHAPLLFLDEGIFRKLITPAARLRVILIPTIKLQKNTDLLILLNI